MNLIEQLAVMDTKAYVIIINLEKDYGHNRTKPMKIGNIGMDKLRNIWDSDVYHIGWSESKNSFFIQIGDKRQTKTKLAMWHVVDTRLKQMGLIKDGRMVQVK